MIIITYDVLIAGELPFSETNMDKIGINKVREAQGEVPTFLVLINFKKGIKHLHMMDYFLKFGALY